jgi:polysaccharide biosynthesis transport protein
MDGLYEQFRIALHSVWRRRWLALAVAWGLCLLGWLVVALIPNSYESRARVFVQMESMLPEQIGITPAEQQRDLVRVKQMLTSTENLEKVVRETELNQLVASDRDLATQIGNLRETIKITAQLDNPNIIEVSATSSVGGFSNAQNAATAQAVVQSLLDLLVEENLSGDRAETGRTLAFLDEELKQRQAQLQEAEQRRMEFEARFLGMLPGTGSISERLSAARIELSGLEQQLIADRSALSALRAQMAATPASIAVPGYSAAGGGSASAQIAALESQLSQARSKGWTDSHPDVVYIQSQIERLGEQAAREGGSGGSGGAATTPNPAYSSLRAMAAEKEAQIASATARKAQIEQAMRDLDARQSADPSAAAEQARLSRDYEVLRRQYEELLAKREQVRLRSDVQTRTDGDFRVIDPPSYPTIPAAPNRPLLLSAILVIAIAGGIGAAFAKAQLQTTFPTQNRLEQATGLPVLGSVSEIFTAEALARRKQQLKWFMGAGGALAGSYAVLMLVEFWQRSTVA